jgi:hypothetical protein
LSGWEQWGQAGVGKNIVVGVGGYGRIVVESGFMLDSGLLRVLLTVWKLLGRLE